MDDDRTVAVHNFVSGSIVGRGKIGRGVDVFALSVGGNVVTVAILCNLNLHFSVSSERFCYTKIYIFDSPSYTDQIAIR